MKGLSLQALQPRKVTCQLFITLSHAKGYNRNYSQVNMKNNFPTLSGSPQPLGATITPAGINFALFSRHAEKVTLVLGLRDSCDSSRFEIPLDPQRHKTGDIWHIHVSGLPSYLRYGYRLSGPMEPHTSGLAYDDTLIMLDPYSKEVRSPRWGQDRTCIHHQTCGLVPLNAYDWE